MSILKQIFCTVKDHPKRRFLFGENKFFGAVVRYQCPTCEREFTRYYRGRNLLEFEQKYKDILKKNQRSIQTYGPFPKHQDKDFNSIIHWWSSGRGHFNLALYRQIIQIKYRDLQN